MKKKVYTTIFLLAIFLVASLVLFNKNNNKENHHIKVADTNITSWTC